MDHYEIQTLARDSIDHDIYDHLEPAFNNSANEDNHRPDDTFASSGEIQKDIVLKKCWKCIDGREDAVIRVNHNVCLNLLLSVLYGISNSLWSGTAYVAYINKLGNGSNGPVGMIEAASGFASLLCALPVGYMADKKGRSIVIRAGGILLFVTASLQISVLQWVGTEFGDEDSPERNKNDTALWLIGAVMIFWGLGDGVVSGPCQALYADSIPEGTRSTFYTYQFACYLTASSVGPLVSILIFHTLGDEWDIHHLRVVMYVGLAMEVCNAWLMMLFDDKKALETNQESTATNDSGDEDGHLEDVLLSSRTPLQKRQEWIPYIVFFSGLISALGNGMTVKFFPLFFKDEVGMSPSQVQVIYMLVPLVMVVLGFLCTKIAGTGVGRVQTAALYNLGAISLLLTMVFFKKYLELHPRFLVPIYVIRTGLMNSTYPLCESILMDYVPKDQRGRWKSLDSVAIFGWCGSAALGGWVADKYDYTHTFFLTAIFEIVSTGVWCLLLPLVPRLEGGEDEASSEQQVYELVDIDIENGADISTV